MWMPKRELAYKDAIYKRIAACPRYLAKRISWKQRAYQAKMPWKLRESSDISVHRQRILIPQYVFHANDIANFDFRSSSLWTCIFKDRKWLELAHKVDTTDIDGYHPSCTPLLIGKDLSGFRTDVSNKSLYFIFLSGDYSGDLRYGDENTTFFASLRDDHEYDEEKQEVRFKSGLIVNVSEVMSGTDEPRFPMQELFPRKKNRRLEYLFLNEAIPIIWTLSPSNIIGIKGPNKTRSDVHYGCVLHVPYKVGVTQ